MSADHRLVVWRHGQTLWNVQRRFQGHTDVDLDDVGRDQARRAARMLASLAPSMIVASDLRRAADTAGELGRLTGLSVRTDEGLRETFAGAWEGLTDPEVRSRFPEEMAAWKRGEDVRRGGDGETMLDAGKRAGEVVGKALAGLGEGQTLVVVSHGGTSRALIGMLLDLPREGWRILGPVANCSWSVLGETPWGWRLLEHNAGSLPEPVLSDDQ